MAIHLPIDGVPQVQPQFFTFSILVFQPEIVGFVGDSQVVTYLEQPTANLQNTPSLDRLMMLEAIYWVF